jgi:hypothetical protein
MYVEVTLKVVSINLQNNYKYVAKALYLLEFFKLPNGLNCVGLSALIIALCPNRPVFSVNSFLEKFLNLKSLILKFVPLNNDIVPLKM